MIATTAEEKAEVQLFEFQPANASNRLHHNNFYAVQQSN